MKLRIYLGLVIAVCIGVLLFLFWPRSSSLPTGPKGDEPIISPLPEGGLPTDGGVSPTTTSLSIDITGFLEVATERTRQGDAVLTDNNWYSIYFNQADSIFIITLLKTPVEEARLKAEADFSKYLNLSKRDLCALDVSLSAPYWVDPLYNRNLSRLDLCASQ